jgi:folate-binding protein YgfZ
MSRNTHLQDRAIFEISGVDRKKFLQGLITNDINKLAPNQLLYSAMLNPQGRFLYDFFIFEIGETIFIDCLKLRVDEIIKKLNFYKLRLHVVIKKNEELVVSWSSEKSEFALKDPRNINLGYRSYQKNIEFNGDDASYHLTRIQNQVAESEYDLTYEKSIILEFGFDDLNAIDYNKGCYIGQELTARTHHLGQVRKKVLYVKLSQKLEKNTEITCEDQMTAIVLSSVVYDNEVHALILKRI